MDNSTNNNLQHIDRAIYSISNEIVPRRKSPVVPIILMLAGVGLMVLSSELGRIPDKENIASSTLFFGVSMVAVCGVITLVRLLNKRGYPYHKVSRRRMREQVVYFDPVRRKEVTALFERGDLPALDAISSENPSPLMMISYRTSDDKVAVMQLHEYVPHNYVPISRTTMYKG